MGHRIPSHPIPTHHIRISHIHPSTTHPPIHPSTYPPAHPSILIVFPNGIFERDSKPQARISETGQPPAHRVWPPCLRGRVRGAFFFPVQACIPQATLEGRFTAHRTAPSGLWAPSVWVFSLVSNPKSATGKKPPAMAGQSMLSLSFGTLALPGLGRGLAAEKGQKKCTMGVVVFFWWFSLARQGSAGPSGAEDARCPSAGLRATKTGGQQTIPDDQKKIARVK